MMSDPARWRDASDAPLGARALLQSARRPAPMSPEVRARTAARVAAIAATPVAAGVIIKWLSGKTLAFFAAFGLLGASIGLIAYLMTRAPASTNAPKSPQAPAVVASSAAPSTSASVVPSTTPVVPSASIVAPPVPSPKTSVSVASSGDTLVKEMELLESARSKLSSDPAGALKDLDTHAARYPAGQLATEREVVAVDALKRLGRTAEAKKRGEAFIARNPKSIYVERVRKLIDGL